MIKKYIIPNWLKEYRIIKFCLFASIFIVLTKNLIFPVVSHKWKGFIFLFIELPIYLFIGERILFKDKFDSKIVSYNYIIVFLTIFIDGIFEYSRSNHIIRQISFWFFVLFIFIIIVLPAYRKILKHFYN